VEERQGLDYSADDYMAKPFSLQELEARVSMRCACRGMGGSITPSRPAGYDQAGRVAFIEGKVWLDSRRASWGGVAGGAVAAHRATGEAKTNGRAPPVCS
jgi:DNA-binding response OmpR family regulator